MPGDPRVQGQPPGALSTRDSRAWRALIAALVRARDDSAALLYELASDPAMAGLLLPTQDAARALRLPRVGVYAPWQGSMDEGWTRWMLDAFDLPFTSVRNEMLRGAALHQFLDLLVLPSISAETIDRGRPGGSVPDAFAGGLDPEGAVAVEEFVRAGGTLVALGSSCEWVIELLRLPLVDECKGPEAGDFSCPGSVLRALPEAHALTVDLPASLAVFFAGSCAWKLMSPEESKTAARVDPAKLAVLARYAPTRLLLSGWIRNAARIEGDAAWVRASHGQGRVHLFGFRPQFRAWTQQSFHLLLRALLLDGFGAGD
jgi:hypothetical protein